MQNRLSRTFLLGGLIALLLTVFVDLAVLVVPIFDMQLYDRVLQSRNMSTLVLLSIACGVGLIFYAALDALRSLTFVVVTDITVSRLSGVVFVRGMHAAAAGDTASCSALVRHMTELQSFLASGAITVPLDALCAPLFILVLFMLHPAFGWLALAGISSLVLLNLLSEWSIGPRLVQAYEARSRADLSLVDSLRDPELIAGLGMLPAVAREWCKKYSRVHYFVDRSEAGVQVLAGASRLIRAILQGGVMALGAFLIIRGQTTPGSLMGANLLLNKCLGPFDHLIGSCKSWSVARNAWRNVAKLTCSDCEPAVGMPVSGLGYGPGLVIDGLGVETKDGSRLLDNISLTIEPGTFVVLSGANGSGKTTLVRALAGILAFTKGQAFLDGHAVCGGRQLGFLPQGTSLLEGTISENIGRFEEDSDEILLAAKLAGVHDEIGRMPDGYNTVVYNNGVNLSVGMRQRLGLARALYGSPNLLLLDEPDANLDSSSSDLLLQAIRERCSAGAIAIVISHRIKTKAAADRVIELRNGSVSFDSSWEKPSLSQAKSA